VFAGVLFLGELALRSYIAGQKGELLTTPNPEYVREAEKSEVAHALYQAMNRGTSRVVINGKARAMKVWLIHRHKNIRPLLNEVMADVKWGKWEPKFLKANGITETISREIVRFLGNTGLDRISIQRLKTELNRKENHKNTFSNAVKQALEGLYQEWSMEGYSLVRNTHSFS
jgi:hypothetical protein